MNLHTCFLPIALTAPARQSVQIAGNGKCEMCEPSRHGGGDGPEGKRVSRISVREVVVASAATFTAAGSAVAVAPAGVAQPNDAQATLADTTLLADTT
ncbi:MULTISPECIES: hypothetical protein [Streptomyces]|uniref:hypothetical protein n=1 Tax=Streptomyces TaxID=1883 RepID=UPI0035E16B89